MKQDVIAALTQYEKYNMVSYAAKLLKEVYTLEGTTSLIRSLRKLLIQLFSHEEEHCMTKHVSSPLQVYHDYVNYCIAYKETGGCRYYSDGSLTVDYDTIYVLPPWEPKDPKTIKMIQEENYKFKLSFERRKDGNAAKDLSEEEIEAQDKDFWKQLNVQKRLFMKYQMYRYVDKKFKPSQKFFTNGKTMADTADIIKQAVQIPGSIRYLDDIVGKLYHALSGLFYCYDNKLELQCFKSDESIAAAYKDRSLVMYSSCTNSCCQPSCWETRCFVVVQDPEIADNSADTLNCTTQLADYKAEIIVNTVYTLQSLVDNGTISGDLKDFLILQGFVRKKEEEKDG